MVENNIQLFFLGMEVPTKGSSERMVFNKMCRKNKTPLINREIYGKLKKKRFHRSYPQRQ